jgi:hypothetical protein
MDQFANSKKIHIILVDEKNFNHAKTRDFFIYLFKKKTEICKSLIKPLI